MSDPVRSVVPMKIDCDTCTAKPQACGDCFVSFLTIDVRQEEPAAPAAVVPVSDRDTLETAVGAVPMDSDQRSAVHVLINAGLVPPLRHAV